MSLQSESAKLRWRLSMCQDHSGLEPAWQSQLSNSIVESQSYSDVNLPQRNGSNWIIFRQPKDRRPPQESWSVS